MIKRYIASIAFVYNFTIVVGGQVELCRMLGSLIARPNFYKAEMFLGAHRNTIDRIPTDVVGRQQTLTKHLAAQVLPKLHHLRLENL